MSAKIIRHAAVLGAGTMGSRIAAHFANAGIPCTLLDLVPSSLTPQETQSGLTLEAPAVRNRVVASGWRAAMSGKPAALFTPDLAALVRTGNFSDHLSWISEADWIIEAVTENLETKRALFGQVQYHRKPGAVVSSNTSGLPLHLIAEGFSEEFQSHFLGTHFFNPPRYLKLLELIPTAATNPEITKFIAGFGEDTLGKGIVICKDTPGFIANRIGIHNICMTLRHMLAAGLTVEEVDQLTGPVLGRPKSATFRTLDVVGLDTFVFIARHLAHSVPDEKDRAAFTLPEFVETMLQKGMLGDKTGQGFYKRLRNGDIHYLDYKTLEYRPLEKRQIPVLEKAAGESPERRMLALGKDNGPAGTLVWRTLAETMSYAAAKVPEISDDIVSIDRAMKWGFGHQAGPFEIWDALGVKTVAARMAWDGMPIPSVVETLLDSKNSSFYRKRTGTTYYFSPARAAYEKPARKPGVILLSSLKDRKKVVLQNRGATLIDLGDGVACLEFHTKMNVIDADVLALMNQAVDRVLSAFAGLVIGNDGENFSAGADLRMILGAARESRWEVIEQAIRDFQSANLKLRYSPRPVVAAPHNLAIGGGCEIAIHAGLIHAAAELYMGFAEVGVGLIPAAGGTKEMALRASCGSGADQAFLLESRVREFFQLIGRAKISTSAREARQLGLLRESDHFTLNAAGRIQAAKDDVLALAREGYRPPSPPGIMVLGRPGFATLQTELHNMERSGFLSAHDQEIGTKLAEVLTGGNFLSARTVTESYLLDLEREAFLSLVGREKTMARMEHMLKTGKPLRN
jgi:3-hydroxyacyl-CoA dehydrogenase